MDSARLVVGMSLEDQEFRRGLDRARASVAGFARGLASAVGVGTFSVALLGASKAALRFSEDMSRVGGLLKDRSKIDELSDSVRALAREFGRSNAEEAGALFKIVQSGARDAATATAQLTAANRLAVASFSDVEDAAGAITAVFDAYGPAAGTAAQVSDKLFTAMRAGQTSIKDLAASFGTVGTFAKEVGVEFDDFLAAVSTIAARTGSATQAMAGLRSVIGAIITPSAEARDVARQLGIQFNAAGLQALGFTGLMEQIGERTGGSVTAMQTLFGSTRELAPALILAAGGASELTRNMADLGKSAATALLALAAVAKTPAQQFALLKAAAADAFLGFGNIVLKTVVPAVIAVNTHMAEIKRVFGEAKEVAVALAKAIGLVAVAILALRTGAAIGALVAFIASLGSLTAALIVARTGVAVFWAVLSAPVTIAVAAIGLIATAFFLAGKAARDAKAEADAFFERAKSLTPKESLAGLQSRQPELLKLRQEELRLNQQVRDAVAIGNKAAVGLFTAQLAEKQAAIRKLEAESKSLAVAFNTATEAARALAVVPPPATGTGGGVKVSMPFDFEELEARVARLTDAQKLVNTAFAVPDLPQKLGQAYDNATAALATHGDRIRAVQTLLAQKGLGLEEAKELREKLRELQDQDIRLRFLAVGLEEIFEGADWERIFFAKPIRPIALGTTIDAPQVRATIDRLVATLPKQLEVPASLRISADTVNLSNIMRSFEKVQQAQGLLDFAKLTGDTSFLAEATDRLNAAQAELTERARTIRDALAAANIPLDEQLKIMLKLGALGDVAGGEANVKRFSENIQAAVQAGRGLLQIADSMGRIGDGARQSIDGVLSLVESIRTLKDAKKTIEGKTTIDIGMQVAGFLGGLGAVVSIMQGIGAEARAQEQERNQILRQNNEELARVQLSLAGFNNSLSQQLNLTRDLQTTEMQAILARIAKGPALTFGLNAQPNRDFLPATRDFIAQLGRMGLSLDQIAAIAKDRGITIRDSQGRLIPEAIAQWAKAVRDAAEAAFEFRDDLNGLRLRENLRRDVLNLPDTPQVAIKADLSFLEQLSPEVFERFFGGIDLTDIAATEAAFQSMTKAFLAGEIDWEKLLEFGSWEEFTAFLQGTADGFDALRDATDAVTRSMLNVPSGLKLQRLIFDATDFTPRSVPTPTLPPAPTPLRAPTLPVPVDTSGLQDDVAGIAQALAAAGIRFDALGGPLDGFATALLDTTARISSAAVTIPGAGTQFPAQAPSPASTPTAEQPPVTLVIEAGAIVIQGTADPEANALAVRDQLQKIARARFGIGGRWSDV